METEIMKMSQIEELKSTMNEMKNSLEGFHSRFKQVKYRINELEDNGNRVAERKKNEKQRI
jgi:chromosome segregation ATPase